MSGVKTTVPSHDPPLKTESAAALTQPIRQVRALAGSDLTDLEQKLRSAGLVQTPAGADVAAQRAAVEHAVGQLSDRLTRVSDKQSPSLQDVVDQVAHRFCGVHDTAPSGNISIETFGTPLGRWSKGNLVVGINATGCSLPATSVINTVMNAFGLWGAAVAAVPGGVSFFTFTLAVAGGPAPDINVQFGGANLNGALSQQPGGALGVGGPSGFLDLLGDVGLPPRPNGVAAFAWTRALLASIVLHESGHVLGLSHSTDPNSIMYPFAPGLVAIDPESILAIRSIYGWTAQHRFDDRASTNGPASAVSSTANFTSRTTTAFLAWKGSKDDDGIWWAQSSDGINWSGQKPVRGVGTADSPALLGHDGIPGVAGTGTIMAWRGVSGDDAIYWSTLGASDWGPQQRGPDAGTSNGPALAAFNGRTYMAWKGAGDDGGIYWSILDPTGWRPQMGPIAGRATSHGPALVAHQGRLLMFWKGSRSDTAIYSAALVDPNNNIWGPQAQVTFTNAGNLASGQTSVGIGSSEGPNALSRGAELILMWKGIPGDSAIWFSRMDAAGQFSGQVSIPNVGTASRPTSFDVNGRLVAFWRGINDDRNLYSASLG